MNKVEFIKKLEYLGYKIINNQSEFLQLLYDTNYVNISNDRVWINHLTDITNRVGVSSRGYSYVLESKYEQIIEKIISEKWYDISRVRNEKLNNILK